MGKRDAAQPGTLYRGQLTYRGAATAAEVRFVKTSRPDSRSAPVELRLPTMPGYVFTYSARLAQRMPIHPAAPTVAAGDPTPAPTAADAEPAPKGDLTVSFVGATGKEGVLDDTVPAQLLNRVRHYSQPGDAILSLRDHRLQGSLLGDGGAGGFVLSTQQVP